MNVRRTCLPALAILSLSFAACGSSAPPLGAAELVVAPPGPAYARYAPPSSVGYAYADLERFRLSPHAEALERLITIAAFGAQGQRAGEENPVLSMFADLEQGLMAFEGGTVGEPLAVAPLLVARGVPREQLAAVVFESIGTPSSGVVAGFPAQVVDGAALVEVGPGEFVFGVQEQQETIIPNPAHLAPAFNTERFVAVQRELTSPQVLEAVVTSAGAELGVGNPLGPLYGVIGASVDLSDEARVVIVGVLDDEASAARIVGAFEGMRQQALAHPLALVLGAQSLLQRIEIRQDGARFRLVASVTADELSRLITQMGGFIEMGREREEAPVDAAPTASPPSSEPVQTI